MSTTTDILRYQTSRIRRNHALEHATLHVLGRRYHKALAGYSDFGGFWLVGEVPTEDVEQAAIEALARLRSGEARLAIQPFCGTTFVTGGVLAGTVAWLAMIGTGRGLKRKLDRWSWVVTLTTLALIVAQPLGLWVQARLTTLAQPGEMQVTGVRLVGSGRLTVHRVTTNG